MRRIRIYKKKKRKINIERLHLEELRVTPNAVGGLCALVGFSSPGAIAGSTAASMMSASATSGVGAGAISAMQSAGALFMNAVGGSTVAAFASVAVPVVAAAGAYYSDYHYTTTSHTAR